MACHRPCSARRKWISSALFACPALPSRFQSLAVQGVQVMRAVLNRYRYDFAVVVLLIVAVSAIYGARLASQPIVGEESRWATSAREMLASGDWVVPRQQGRVFAERPPLTMWAMAAVGFLRGDVDAIAIRLPSIMAIVLTTLVLYVYARSLLSPFVAVASAIVYATFGQVLQIGRLGESEALFTLFVSASLLLWHLAYMSGWRPIITWSIGFGFAALAALVKGPQAPVYFVAITGAYLIVRRDWRYLLSWQFAAGAAVFAAVVAAWQVPFYRATDWPTAIATWSGLAADRIHLGGMMKHLVTYPMETFVCLLPWSPLLVALAKRETRALVDDCRPVITFLFTAILVAYPTVWIAAGARGRYFMPLYPLVAVLIGLIIERCATASAGTYRSRAWRQFLLLCSILIGVGGAAIGVSGLLPDDWSVWLHQPRAFSVVFGIAAAFVAYMLWKCCHAHRLATPLIAMLSIAAIVGVAYSGLMLNVNIARWHDPTTVVARLRSELPPDSRLVSFTPIEHRFVYYYKTPIAEIEWPAELRDLPADVEYFCFMRNPGDTAERRIAGRGRTWTTSSGTLPFAWEEITSICVERRVRKNDRTVVLGRVVRPLQAMVSNATVSKRR